MLEIWLKYICCEISKKKKIEIHKNNDKKATKSSFAKTKFPFTETQQKNIKTRLIQFLLIQICIFTSFARYFVIIVYF